MPRDAVYRVFRDYVAVFDSRTRCPKWVIEHVTRDKGQGSANRRARRLLAALSDMYYSLQADRSRAAGKVMLIPLRTRAC